MPQLILGLLALWLVLTAIKQFGRISPATAAKIVRGGGRASGLALIGLMLLRGFGGLAGLAVSLLLSGAFRGGGGFGLGSSRAARISQVRSPAIAMRLDRDTGAMSGEVIGGPHAGRSLDALARADVLGVWRWCRSDDPQGAALVEAYLDRRFPGWREAHQSDRDAGARGGGGAMTRNEAYEVLGLTQGAGRQEIVAAHRSLMKKFHPDHGGTTALAARINQAKDILLD